MASRITLLPVLVSIGGCFLPEVELASAPTDAEMCLDCAAEGCPDEYDSCLDQSDCDALLSCALECSSGDNECLAACALTYPDGIDGATALGECTAEACPEDCGSLTF